MSEDEAPSAATTESAAGAAIISTISEPSDPKSRDPPQLNGPEDPAEVEVVQQVNKGKRDDIETATDATADSDKPLDTEINNTPADSSIVVSSHRKSRPPYIYDPNKITLRFLFANRDGLTVTVECKPTDTVGEVKGALISVWPDGELR